ncbi:MFS transporter [Streptomyces caelestis]|uniref:DHA1 family inner membrane transport protein n=1 Tax=Streptomyces caelestis TaxID=36816 RepID=A0A7W9HD20_9ACTN|nr:MFS transporter [Streptomyces caelestis]MBB5799741.1 DHA1 family inner membrane transport protein [Streptomyces caelestis]GGW72815.1 MFS transporter [Streptomyces caelestis]
MPPLTDDRSAKLPFVVLVLAAGIFLMGTTEFVIAGLLPEISDDLGVSVSHAGLLITAFAVGMIVGAPAMAIATLRLPRRFTLVLALTVFALGHVVAALSPSFAVVLAARVVTALATGTFWSVAAVVATTAAGPAMTSRALGMLLGGMTVANIASVPLGSWLGQVSNWRGPFWVLAALSAAAAAVIGRYTPDEEQREARSVRAEFAALCQGRVWLALSAIALLMGGVLATYTYISPLLTERAQIPAAAVPLVLTGYGAGALLGTTVGGRLGDRRPLATLITAAATSSLILLLLVFFSTSPVVTVVLVTVMGVTAFAASPVLGALVRRFAGSAPTLASALASSSSNVGVAVGSWVAGIALASPLRQAGPPLVGTVTAALTLVPLTALVLMRATRSDDHAAASDPSPRGRARVG